MESGVDRSFSREFQDQEKDLIRKFSQPKKEDLGEGSRESGTTNREKRKGERKQRLKRMRKLMLRNLKLKQR